MINTTLEFKIINKNVINSIYEKLTNRIDFCININSIDTILIRCDSIILLNENNNWIGNFSMTDDINDMLNYWINNSK